MAEQEHGPSRAPLRWAAGAAILAAGATAVFDRVKAKREGRSGEQNRDPSARELDAEFEAGRGEPRGGVSAASKRAGYELKDARVRDLAVIMVVSVALIGGSLAGVYAIYGSFDRHFAKANADMTAEQKTVLMPPLPHLQAEPYRDIDALVMEQQQRLDSYGWNDPDHKSGHIPIERAMEQVVGKPLDATAEADAAGAPGTTSHLPQTPAFPAAQQQSKPANDMPGEGNIIKVEPSYNASEDLKAADDKAEKEKDRSK